LSLAAKRKGGSGFQLAGPNTASALPNANGKGNGNGSGYEEPTFWISHIGYLLLDWELGNDDDGMGMDGMGVAHGGPSL